MRIRSILAALLATTFVTSAHAADWLAPQADHGFRGAVFDWTGGYLGAHAGWHWSDYSASVGSVSLGSVDTDGALVGLQAGYGVQFDTYYLGLEADFTYMDREIGPDWANVDTAWQGSLRGRIGVPVDNILIYGTGGIAFAHSKATLLTLTEDDTHVGWIIGAGIDAAVGDKWSVRGEYLYSRFSEDYFGLDVDLDTHVARVGFNYHFD